MLLERVLMDGAGEKLSGTTGEMLSDTSSETIPDTTGVGALLVEHCLT
jgi:hypothetical protein